MPKYLYKCELCEEMFLAHHLMSENIEKREGWSLEPYVPINKKTREALGTSGVTIGSGVDLGVLTEDDLVDMGIDAETIQKVSPFLGKQKQDAIGVTKNYYSGMEASKGLVSEPLQDTPSLLTQDQARKLTSAVQQKNVDKIAATYEKHRQMLLEKDRGKAWQDLTRTQRTVITSVGFQHGHNFLRKKDESGNRKPMDFIKQAARNDWNAVIDNLRDFKDQHPTRRKKEADELVASLPSEVETQPSFVG